MPKRSKPIPDDGSESSDLTVQLMRKLIAAAPDRFSKEAQDRLFAERAAWKTAVELASTSRAPAAKAAERAFEGTTREIVLRSQKLVFDLAKKYQERSRADRFDPGTGIPLADLIQEGNRALSTKAVEKFVPGGKARFTTFASLCISHHLSDVLEKWKSFPQPKRTGGSTRGKNAKPASGPDQLAPLSLDAPAGPETDASLVDFVPDPKSGAGLKRFYNDDLRKRLRQVIDTLTDREREVLEFRFGLADGLSRVLEEVGKQFHVTRDRIRMIEKKALKKLRRPPAP